MPVRFLLVCVTHPKYQSIIKWLSYYLEANGKAFLGEAARDGECRGARMTERASAYHCTTCKRGPSIFLGDFRVGLSPFLCKEMEEVVRGFDALLCPTTPTPAPDDLSGTGDPAFQKPWTNCGFPSITIPSGLSESSLPLGVQLASGPFADAPLLATAHWCEHVLGVDLRPPQMG